MVIPILLLMLSRAFLPSPLWDVKDGSMRCQGWLKDGSKEQNSYGLWWILLHWFTSTEKTIQQRLMVCPKRVFISVSVSYRLQSTRMAWWCGQIKFPFPDSLCFFQQLTSFMFFRICKRVCYPSGWMSNSTPSGEPVYYVFSPGTSEPVIPFLHQANRFLILLFFLDGCSPISLGLILYIVSLLDPGLWPYVTAYIDAYTQFG